MANNTTTVNGPNALPDNRQRDQSANWTYKLFLRGISFVCDVVVIAIGAVIVDSRGSILACLGGPCCISALWDFAESICLITRPGRSGIHPGAIVGVDLLLWLGFIPALVFGSLEFSYGRPHDKDNDATVALIFGAMNTLLHFVLFIIGCRETHVRNNTPFVVYVTTDENGILLQGPKGVELVVMNAPRPHNAPASTLTFTHLNFPSTATQRRDQPVDESTHDPVPAYTESPSAR